MQSESTQAGAEFRARLSSDHVDPRQTYLHVQGGQDSKSLCCPRACAVQNSTFKCEIRILQFKGNLLQDIEECSCRGPGGSHPGSEGTCNWKRKTHHFPQTWTLKSDLTTVVLYPRCLALSRHKQLVLKQNMECLCWDTLITTSSSKVKTRW